MKAELRFGAAADHVLAAARQRGADDVEIYVAHGTELTVRVYEGEVESLTSAEARGLGVRVFSAGRMGFAYTSDLSDEGLALVVDDALAASRHTQPDEHVRLPEAAPDEEVPSLVADDFAALSVPQRVAVALELDRRVVGVRTDVRRCAGTTYGDERTHVELHTSRGVRAAFETTAAYAVTEAIAERDGEMQSATSFTYARSASGLDLEGCAEEAARRAARLLGAAPVGSRRCPILLEPWAAASLLAALAPSVGADAVLKGRSLLAGRLGEAVAATPVSLVDDGRLPDGLASRPWDAEGVPTRRTEVVAHGVLRSYLHTTYTARRSGPGTSSTGNAVRASYRSTPEVGPTNLHLVPGTLAAKELLRRLDEGIVVYELRGLHTVNAVTGEFSLGVSGALVRGGEIAEPVREITIAGTLLELLGAVQAVASDLRFHLGAGFVGSPSVLVGEVAVSGA